MLLPSHCTFIWISIVHLHILWSITRHKICTRQRAFYFITQPVNNSSIQTASGQTWQNVGRSCPNQRDKGGWQQLLGLPRLSATLVLSWILSSFSFSLTWLQHLITPTVNQSLELQNGKGQVSPYTMSTLTQADKPDPPGCATTLPIVVPAHFATANFHTTSRARMLTKQSRKPPVLSETFVSGGVTYHY